MPVGLKAYCVAQSGTVSLSWICRNTGEDKHLEPMRLKITSFGTEVEGISLKGDPRNPEPTHTRICIPRRRRGRSSHDRRRVLGPCSGQPKGHHLLRPVPGHGKVTDARADNMSDAGPFQRNWRTPIKGAVRVGDIEPRLTTGTKHFEGWKYEHYN